MASIAATQRNNHIWSAESRLMRNIKCELFIFPLHWSKLYWLQLHKMLNTLNFSQVYVHSILTFRFIRYSIKLTAKTNFRSLHPQLSHSWLTLFILLICHFSFEYLFHLFNRENVRPSHIIHAHHSSGFKRSIPINSKRKICKSNWFYESTT